MPAWAVAIYHGVIEAWRTDITAACGALSLASCFVLVLSLLLRLQRRVRASKKLTERYRRWTYVAMAIVYPFAIVDLVLVVTATAVAGLVQLTAGDLLLLCAIGAGAAAVKCAFALARLDRPEHARPVGPRALSAVGGFDFVGAVGWSVATGILTALALWVLQH